MKHGMFIGFIMITSLAAIHYDYGMDYMSYMDTFDKVVNGHYTFYELIVGEVLRQHEVGWAILNWLFGYLGKYGFFWMVAILSIFQNIIYYRFIRNYVPQKWWILAVMIYVFSTHYYLINFSMMRQGLAIALVLWSYDYICQKKMLPALLILACAPLIHRSSLIMVPFAFWEYLPLKKGSFYVVLYSAIFIILFLSRELLDQIFGVVFQFEDFEYYYEAHGSKTNNSHFGIGFFLNLIPFVVSLRFLGKNDVDNDKKRLVALACIGTMILPFTQIIALANRLGLYFSVFNLASIPYAYDAINNKVAKSTLVIVYVGMLFLEYTIFFQNETFFLSYAKFHTIFSVI